MLKTIALDAMSGDHGLSSVIPAAIATLKKHQDIALILVGNQDLLKPLMQQQAAAYQDRWHIHHAKEVVTMHESPSSALRNKKDSSMRVAINLVKTGEAHACVSAGNTGALMATARFVLKMATGVDRPAIVKGFPTRRGKAVYILDLGANVDSTPQHLFQFAVMGSVLASVVENQQTPRVALLNIGEEDIKGNELVKKAAELIQSSQIVNFIGSIEGDMIFDDEADVIVCDGFVGNVTLKAVEGVAKLIAGMAKETFQASWLSRLAVLPAVPLLKRLVKRIDPERHNGATLLGLNGIVIKSHGGATAHGFSHAIEEAIIEVRKNLLERIKTNIGSLLDSQETH